MEDKEGINGFGAAVRSDKAPQSYRVENSVQFGGLVNPPTAAAPAIAAAPAVDVKKKRGRPRKYARDGAIVALSPMPISASIPLAGDYSGWKQSGGRSVDSLKKKNKLDFGNPGRSMAYPVGGSFTPHMITVNTGEDIMMKIISFSQQVSRAICILAANGTISNVTLRQPNSSGGTLTYEGCFEILSLTGSFMPNDNGVTKSRSGGMSVSLAGPDGRVLGGGLAGMLVAAGPIQVVIGSFIPGNQQQEQKPKKPKYENTITFANPIAEAYSAPNPNLTTSASFHGDNLHGSSVPLQGEESREQSHEMTY